MRKYTPSRNAAPTEQNVLRTEGERMGRQWNSNVQCNQIGKKGGNINVVFGAKKSRSPALSGVSTNTVILSLQQFCFEPVLKNG